MKREFINETLIPVFFRFCCSDVVSELLSKCGLMHVDIFLKELDAWNDGCVGGDRASQLRSHSFDFLERFITSLA